jgi:small subunit ribosomal protein S8
MNMTDPVGDMLTRIRNAQMRRKTKVSTPASSLRGRVLDVLQSEGYIRGYAKVDYGTTGQSEYEIELKYYDGEPVIRKIERVSKPGRRVYASVKALPRVMNGLGVSILSTPKGVMSDHDAREQNVGGEVLCRVF